MAQGPLPRSRARNLVELYFRAYWRYYVVAVTWACSSTFVLEQATPFVR